MRRPRRTYRFRRRSRKTRGTFHAMNFAVRKRRGPLISIVSLVDILIILLIFFVVSTTFKKDQTPGQINLPETNNAQKKPSVLRHAGVSIDRDDQIRMDRRAVRAYQPEVAGA